MIAHPSQLKFCIGEGLGSSGERGRPWPGQTRVLGPSHKRSLVCRSKLVWKCNLVHFSSEINSSNCNVETWLLTDKLNIQVGGVHFNLLSKVRRDIGETLSLDQLIDSIFPMFRSHIEPDLYHAQVDASDYLSGVKLKEDQEVSKLNLVLQIKISNNVVSLSLREPFYILKTEKQVSYNF